MKNSSKGLLTLAAAAVLVAGLLLLSGCGKDKASDDKTVRVGASPTPHAEILKAAEPELKKEGYKLKIVEFEDYVKPNQALTDGDIDANYFQHILYLNDYNKKNDTGIEVAAKIHFEPLGLYKGQKDSLEDLAEGDKIAIPNDTTNEARALLLLQDAGVITLREGVGLEATKKDIVSNPKSIEIKEVEAAIIPKTLPDVALGVINGNYALGAKLSEADRIKAESPDSENVKDYINVLAVDKGKKDSAKIKALVKALQSDAVRKYIEDNYKGSVVPAFE